MSTRVALPLLNSDDATFECTFGRGCEGICCKDGKPDMFLYDLERIDANLDRVLPRMRPEAQRVAQKKGYLDRRATENPTLRTVEGWCIFFNQGCVLHALGAEEGDKFKYKPMLCAWFPLWFDKDGNWFVRQKGYQKENYDLFCLHPGNSKQLAVETLQEEMAVIPPFLKEQARKGRWLPPGPASRKP